MARCGAVRAAFCSVIRLKCAGCVSLNPTHVLDHHLDAELGRNLEARRLTLDVVVALAHPQETVLILSAPTKHFGRTCEVKKGETP